MNNLTCLIVWWIGFPISSCVCSYINTRIRQLQGREVRGSGSETLIDLMLFIAGTVLCFIVKQS